MRIARVAMPGEPIRLVDVAPDGSTGVVLHPVGEGSATETRLEVLLADGDPRDVLVPTGAAIRLDRPDVQWLPAVTDPRIIVCAGQNFPAHAEESTVVASPSRPSAFLRVPHTLSGHGATIPYPGWATSQLDYEVEVAAVLGAAAGRADRDPEAAIAGLCLANDISARDIQFEEARAGSMLLGKNLPGTLPLGPWLTTLDEVGDLSSIEIVLTVNGDARQHDVLGSMSYSLPELIRYWSVLGFRPGDLVLTGTPVGIAIFRDDPEAYFLRPGDDVRCESPQLGRLRTRIGASERAREDP